jgi:hypothetical protein
VGGASPAYAYRHHGTCVCPSLWLCLQSGDAFQAAADAYVRGFIVKGIPSLFSGQLHVRACVRACVCPLKPQVHANMRALVCVSVCVCVLEGWAL